MIPRYRPAIDLPAWAPMLSGRRGPQNASDGLVHLLGVRREFRCVTAFATLREGIYDWFLGLRRRKGAGYVLMSSQICPVVPMAARAAGHELQFADIARDFPTPGPAQIVPLLGPKTVAIVVAPLYGHIQSDWSALTSIPARPELFLDLAQGLGHDGCGAPMSHASAVGYSFGIGKGMDTGGGLLLSCDAPDSAKKAEGSFAIGTLGKSILLRALMAGGLYGLVAKAVAKAAEPQPQEFRPLVRTLDLEKSAQLWSARLRTLAKELEIARTRALDLRRCLENSSAVADTAVYFSPTATHLRQIVKVTDPARRDRVVAALLARGIDCAPAGERPPWTYLPQVEQRSFPNTTHFLATAIRLPFLARLSEREYVRVREALGVALG
jgi:dTDP-4-amino-4,6-dideoxygalactose transaminase